MENNWIEYYRDRSVEIPKTGFIDYQDTFYGEKRIYTDRVEDIHNISWNRAAPACISKFRFITEKDYLENQQQKINVNIKKLVEDCNDLYRKSLEIEERLRQLNAE